MEVPLKSDLKKIVPDFLRILRYKGEKDLFDSCGNLIERIASKPVLASELARGDMFRA